MQIFSITLITAIATFLLFLWYNGFSGKPLIISGWQIHHSVVGVSLFLIGLFLEHQTVLSIGLGLYVSHVAEEIYFEGESLGHALVIFVTRA
ncbi:MAG: hypothetical protein HYW65_04635 [Candidatus Liptonbacteria bacterium]|nr:hypothetical protein [Candidatus Liptonbacteria bacterium]